MNGSRLERSNVCKAEGEATLSVVYSFGMWKCELPAPLGRRL